MPRAVTDIDTLQRYIQAVLERSAHHAKGVRQVAIALAGAVVWKKDADPIEVMEREGDMKNVLWVRISGKRYVFSYNHAAQAIDMRMGTTAGPTLKSFSASTNLSEIVDTFDAL